MNGCHEPLPSGVVLVELGGFSFNRCPMVEFDEDAEVVGGMARRGALKSTPIMDALKWPAKLYIALLFCDWLLQEEKRE